MNSFFKAASLQVAIATALTLLSQAAFIWDGAKLSKSRNAGHGSSGSVSTVSFDSPFSKSWGEAVRLADLIGSGRSWGESFQHGDLRSFELPSSPKGPRAKGGVCFQPYSITASLSQSGSITVAGFGIARAEGMKDTLAAFTMKGNQGKFSYRVEMAQTTVQARSQNAAKHVPDGGGTVALLGVSLLGLQGGRRLLRSIRT